MFVLIPMALGWGRAVSYGGAGAGDAARVRGWCQSPGGIPVNPRGGFQKPGREFRGRDIVHTDNRGVQTPMHILPF